MLLFQAKGHTKYAVEVFNLLAQISLTDLSTSEHAMFMVAQEEAYRTSTTIAFPKMT